MGGERRYHHGDLRSALLVATLELVRERGARGFSVIEAARRAGVSPAAPYRHFPDRDAMLAAAAQQGFEYLTHTLDQLPAGTGFHDCAAYISLQYVHFAEANPAYFEVMFLGGLTKADFPDLLRQAGQVQKRLESALSPYGLKPDTTLRAAEL